jgi:cytoskeletal protein CcmA (bactofilin family)
MFSRDKSGPSGAGRGETFSFIGPEVTVTGDIATPGQLHVDGKVIGDVTCGSLSQGESGSIIGNINADDAKLSGLIDGAVSAGTLLLETSSRITGDVLYETLTVATGAQVDGRFKRRQAEADGSRKAKLGVLPASSAPARSEVAAGPASGLFAGGAAEETAEAAE